MHGIEATTHEPSGVLLAGHCVRGQLQVDVAHVDDRPGHDALPGQARDGDVLPRQARSQRVALGAEGVDDVRGPQADRLPRATVVLAVVLAVSHRTEPGDLQRLLRLLGYPTVAD